VRRFFEVTVPARLERDRQRAGAISGSCLFDVTGDESQRGRWLVDFTARPPAVLAAPAGADGDGDGDCQVQLSAADLAAVIADPAAAQVLAWQGRMRISGDQALMRKATTFLFRYADSGTSVSAGYYASLARLIPDPRLTFLNYGYADDDDDFSWLDDADRPWRYCINLIRRTLDDAPVAGARVLDVGCGRGGPAAYIARHLEPLAVTALDASSDEVRLCRERHSHPGLEFVHGDAQHLPMPDASIDVVVNVESSHCYPDMSRFFSEVARVLRPDGAFCYSDLFGEVQLAAVQRRLAETPGLRVQRMADITPEVVRAIERNRESFAELLLSMADGRLSNISLIANLIRTVNVQLHAKLAAGAIRYHAWRIGRAAT